MMSCRVSAKSVRSDLKKLDSFTLEMSKNYLIRNFLRKGRLRVKWQSNSSSFNEVRKVMTKCTSKKYSNLRLNSYVS